MLADRSIVDSARLPRGAIQEQPVEITAERLVHSLHRESSSQFSRPGRSERDLDSRHRRLEQAVLAADPLDIESTALRNMQRNVDEAADHTIHYHPLRMSDGNVLDSVGGLPGMVAS